MNTEQYKVGKIEPGIPIPERSGQTLTSDQQRFLELKDGESFVLEAIQPIEGEGILPRSRYHSASRIAARLSCWARVRRIRLAYRVIDKNTVRIWRVGAI